MVCKSCCHEQKKFKKGLWSPEEDHRLRSYVLRYGHGCWSEVPKHAGLQRCGKSCRLRWINYLRPGLKRGIFSSQEEMIIINAHAMLGNRWSRIASMLPGRTDNEVKNFWNSHLTKKLKILGIDPSAHGPIGDSSKNVISDVSKTMVSKDSGQNFISENEFYSQFSMSGIAEENTMPLYTEHSTMQSATGLGYSKDDPATEFLPENSNFLSLMFSEWLNSIQNEAPISNVASEISRSSAMKSGNSGCRNSQTHFLQLNEDAADSQVKHIISSDSTSGLDMATFSKDGSCDNISWRSLPEFSMPSEQSIFGNGFSSSLENTAELNIAEYWEERTSDSYNDVNLAVHSYSDLFENCSYPDVDLS